jgi:hypothetical protein
LLVIGFTRGVSSAAFQVTHNSIASVAQSSMTITLLYSIFVRGR